MSNASYTARQIHCGQYKSYDDFYRVWEIKTDASEEATLEYCFAELYTRRVPSSGEYHANIRYGGDKWNDADYYFAGYYRLEPIDGGYKFTICEPFAD